MSHFSRKITIATVCSLLIACGGGGGSPSTSNSSGTSASSQPAASTATSAPPSSTSGSPSSNATNSGVTSGGNGSIDSGNASTSSGSGVTPDSQASSGPDNGAFAAAVTQAPSDGAIINGTVRILVEGSNIGNVELLPGSGYAPLIARGVVTGDKLGAYIDLDTTVMPDGPITLRVAAFNMPPGQGGSEITAMPPRTWTIRNDLTPSFSAQLLSAPPDGTFLGFSPYSNSAHFEVGGKGLENVELVSAKDESIIYGRFTISPDKTRAILDWRFYNWSYGSYNLRVVAWDAPPGQPGRKIEVMAPRYYTVHLPLGCQAERTCGGAAP